MTALYIVLGILLLIFLILLIRVQVFMEYSDTIRLSVKVLFVKIRLIDPDKEKKPKMEKPEKKKKKKKPEKKKEETEEKEKKKKPNMLQKLKDKKGVTGLLSLFTSLAKIAGGMLKGLFSHIVIHRLDVGLAIKGSDASDTALTYGKLCSVIYPSINIITAATKTKDYHITVEPVFDDSRETEVYANIHAHLRIIWAVWEVLKAAVKVLWVRIRL